VALPERAWHLDLSFAPDGVERFEDAWRRRMEVEVFPVCHLDDIIASKAATNRQKDRKSPPSCVPFENGGYGAPIDEKASPGD
jgi:hypothetical protein